MIKTPVHDQGSAEGVYGLINRLCETLYEDLPPPITKTRKKVVSKMRARALEVLLKNSSQRETPTNTAISELLLYYYNKTCEFGAPISDLRRLAELKTLSKTMSHTGYSDKYSSVVRFLIALADSNDYVPAEIPPPPFTFGLRDEMLPRPCVEPFGSPEPYSYCLSSLFNINTPFGQNHEKGIITNEVQYTVNSQHSQSVVPMKTVQSNLSPIMLSSSNFESISTFEPSLILFPRISDGRDLIIPLESDNAANVTVSLATTPGTKPATAEMYHAQHQLVDIWEIARQPNPELAHNVWDDIAKMPTLPTSRPKMSPKQIHNWYQQYANVIPTLQVVSEEHLIRHLMYLIFGIESSSFYVDKEEQVIYATDNLAIEGVPMSKNFSTFESILNSGTYYLRLHQFAFDGFLDHDDYNSGLIYEALKKSIRQYLLVYRQRVSAIFSDKQEEGRRGLPTIVEIVTAVEIMQPELLAVAEMLNFHGQLNQEEPILQHGGKCLSYLFDYVMKQYNMTGKGVLRQILINLVNVYFKFIEKFIFSGEVDDPYSEFFVSKDDEYVRSRSEHYWSDGFYPAIQQPPPVFWRDMARSVLLCGKSLRLFKMCSPRDPLVHLITSDHPSIAYCASFAELDRQKRLLDVYRTRCRFVSGQRPSFEEILLKREAQRKAFAEIATQKQAENMEKIISERKRLAQLVIAEKQHSLKVLEAAIQESKAVKLRGRLNEKRLEQLENEAQVTVEEVDAKILTQETSNIMDYYSKLNMEVEKNKAHTEWKMKRLQLDPSRIQLLSTEERSLKREKFELERRRSEESMAMSIRSDDFLDANDDDVLIEQQSIPTEMEINRAKSQESNVCFPSGLRDTPHSEICDNKKVKDSQGNVVVDTNSNTLKTSSSIIGAVLDSVYDNLQFLKNREAALENRNKVLQSEYDTGDLKSTHNDEPKAIVDSDNNIQAKINKAKVLGTEFNLTPEPVVKSEPRTDAQREAVANKNKVLGVEYNLPALPIHKKEPMNVAQDEAEENRRKDIISELWNVSEPVREKSPMNVAQEEAEDNRRKDIVSELWKVSEPVSEKSPMNVAQEEALVNKKKYQNSELLISCNGARQRLSLNLAVSTPQTNNIDDGDFEAITPCTLTALALETPNTAEARVLAEDLKLFKDDFSMIEPEPKQHSEFPGFDLSVEEDGLGWFGLNDGNTSQLQSPVKPYIPVTKQSCLNILNNGYGFDDFNPFGLPNKETSVLGDGLTAESKQSCYTHPAAIMREVQKKPYNNIFASQLPNEGTDIWSSDEYDKDGSLESCLHRSVMLPLSCQLEIVNNAILNLYLVELDLYEHLRSLKDYYFLMDGEFSRTICHNLFAKLSTTINPQELLNYSTLHNILGKALGSSISQIHKCSENLSFTILETPSSFHHSSPDALQCLSLSYSVRWPLNIILSHEALVRYSKVFQFLLKMRRVDWVLKQDLEHLKHTAKNIAVHERRRLQRSHNYTAVQSYRHIMTSLIRSLDNYIVNTCILVSWTEMESDMKKAKTLDDLCECHVVYVKKVLFRCLLNNRSTPVMKLLNDIFTIVLKFSRVLIAGNWHSTEHSDDVTHSNFRQLEELFNMFKKLVIYLHKVISRLIECGYQRHLAELLCNINWNGYYDMPKQINTSKQMHNNSG